MTVKSNRTVDQSAQSRDFARISKNYNNTEVHSTKTYLQRVAMILNLIKLKKNIKLTSKLRVFKSFPTHLASRENEPILQ